MVFWIPLTDLIHLLVNFKKTITKLLQSSGFSECKSFTVCVHLLEYNVYEWLSARTALAVSGGSTELADLLQGDSLWTAVYGKVNFFWIRANLVEYGRYEKKVVFEKIAKKNYVVVWRAITFEALHARPQIFLQNHTEYRSSFWQNFGPPKLIGLSARVSKNWG